MATPFEVIGAKLIAGQNATMQFIGDSTCQGIRSIAYSFSTVVDPNRGWPARLGKLIGQDFNVHVSLEAVAYTGTSPVWSGSYTLFETIHVATGTGRPTLTIRNGGIGASYTTQQQSWISAQNMIPSAYPDPDVIMIASGFNDMMQTAYLPRITALVSTIRTRCPSTPIIITTENRSMGFYPTSSFINGFSSMTINYTGNGMNLTPAFQQSVLADTNIWVLDTQQAYPVDILSTLLSLDDTVGGLHPNSDGYAAEAAWIYDFWPPPLPPAPIITTDTLLDIIRTEYFHQFIGSTGDDIEWSISDGSLPAGLTFSDSPPSISGYPTSFGGTYDFTLRAENDYGFDEQQYTGEIISYVYPFIPDREVRWKMKWHGKWYPVKMKVKKDGAFKPIVFKA
jgi:lysophospholipase L1-like esterase